MGTNNLTIKIHNSVEEAPNWNKIGGYKAATIQEAHIVKGGTQAGNPTVDFVFTDDKGQKHVALITAGLMENLAAAIRACKPGVM